MLSNILLSHGAAGNRVNPPDPKSGRFHGRATRQAAGWGLGASQGAALRYHFNHVCTLDSPLLHRVWPAWAARHNHEHACVLLHAYVFYACLPVNASLSLQARNLSSSGDALVASKSQGSEGRMKVG